MTPIQKAKEIAVKFYIWMRDKAKPPSEGLETSWFDTWLATPEASALLSGEDWKEDGKDAIEFGKWLNIHCKVRQTTDGGITWLWVNKNPIELIVAIEKLCNKTKFSSNPQHYVDAISEIKNMLVADGQEGKGRIIQFFDKVRLVEIIEGFSDFYNNYKNIDPPKGLTTIIQEYVRELALPVADGERENDYDPYYESETSQLEKDVKELGADGKGENEIVKLKKVIVDLHDAFVEQFDLAQKFMKLDFERESAVTGGVKEQYTENDIKDAFYAARDSFRGKITYPEFEDYFIPNNQPGQPAQGGKPFMEGEDETKKQTP